MSAKPKPTPKPVVDEAAQPAKIAPYVMLVRSAIAALQHANVTNDYAVLRSLSTPALQTRLTADEFSNSFAVLRKQGTDLSPALVVAPRFTERPEGIPAGRLQLAGYFPTRPQQINFVIIYQSIGEKWLIDALSVSTTAPGAAATPSQPKQEPPTQAAPKSAEVSPRDESKSPAAAQPSKRADTSGNTPVKKATKAEPAATPAKTTSEPDADAGLNAISEVPLLRDAATPKTPEAESEASTSAKGNARPSTQEPVHDAAEMGFGETDTANEKPAPEPPEIEESSPEPPPPLPLRKPRNAASYVTRELLSPLPLSPEQANRAN